MDILTYVCTKEKPYTLENVQALLREIWDANKELNTPLRFIVTHKDCDCAVE